MMRIHSIFIVNAGSAERQWLFDYFLERGFLQWVFRLSSHRPSFAGEGLLVTFKSDLSSGYPLQHRVMPQNRGIGKIAVTVHLLFADLAQLKR
jgi:hypothetical protein